MNTPIKIGLIGGRGFVGAELVKLINQHPKTELAFASSTSNAGKKIEDLDLEYRNLQPDDLRNEANLDVLILALGNAQSTPWVHAIDTHMPDTCIVDISADHRFDASWIYGLPEINFKQIRGATRIANPGCYATAAQLALAPIANLLDGPPSCFGVSGYSGAGATPNPRNDQERLKNNLIPYSLQGHIHEDEISAHLGRAVKFSPHVAAFFRGISMTIHAKLIKPMTQKEIFYLVQAKYQSFDCVQVQIDIPEVREVALTDNCCIGGFTIDESGCHLTMVSVLDNMRKGAASQALQNILIAKDQ